MSLNNPQTLGLAQALQSLADAINQQNQNRNAQSTPIHDLFASGQPLNLGGRLGMEAFHEISKALPQTWDGDTGSFPSFVINLRLRAIKSKWHAIDGSGILMVDGKNIFTEFHSITDTNITQARTNRTNDRATQNSKALYQCLESSISGALKTTIFSQTENIPEHEDGVHLFKSITNFTAVSSFQLSNLSLQQILDFDPAELDFQISNINTKLIHLFMLATMKS